MWRCLFLKSSMNTFQSNNVIWKSPISTFRITLSDNNQVCHELWLFFSRTFESWKEFQFIFSLASWPLVLWKNKRLCFRRRLLLLLICIREKKWHIYIHNKSRRHIIKRAIRALSLTSITEIIRIDQRKRQNCFYFSFK
jgi:hypothetical protein